MLVETCVMKPRLDQPQPDRRLRKPIFEAYDTASARHVILHLKTAAK
jgi:hypothetical protein